MDATEAAVPNLRELFAVGAQVSVEFQDVQGLLQSHRTLVADVDASVLTLLAPTQRGAVIQPALGSEVAMWVRHHAQVYVAMAHVLGLTPANPPEMRTTLPVRAERTTHRRYYRVEVDLPVETSLGPGRLIDLSGGGCCLAVDPADLPASSGMPAGGSTLTLAVPLPGAAGSLGLQGRVVRGWSSGIRQYFAIEFVQITMRQQDLIIRYLVQRQQELLRQGLLRRPSSVDEEG